MTIPLYFFLYAYWAFLSLWALFALVALYHMFRYSWKTFASFLVILIFVGVSGFIFLFSYNYIDQINWEKEVTVFSGFVNSSNSY